MFKQIFGLLLFSILFYGCTEEIEPDTKTLGLNFYPLNQGEFWIYKVTVTNYKNQFEADGQDSISYFVKEQIDTIYKDLTQENTYKFIRSRRNSLNEEWSSDSVFVVNKSLSDVRLLQNNRKVVPFIFPVKDGKKWNANIFNTQSGLSDKSEVKFYYFSDYGKPEIINGVNYPITVKVNQVYNQNAIEYQNLYEVYGLGIGRIYKQVLTFNYCSDPDRQNGCEVGQQFIITGKKRTEKLLEHGISK